jgi:hypothetical protein
MRLHETVVLHLVALAVTLESVAIVAYTCMLDRAASLPQRLIVTAVAAAAAADLLGPQGWSH